METDERVQAMLQDLTRLNKLADALDIDLKKTSTYCDLLIARAEIDKCEDQIKAQLKLWGEDGSVVGGEYEALLQTRHGKGTVTYDIPAIEAQPWGAGCIVKAVNGTVFKAIVTSLSLDMNLFATTEPGTETKAVTIRKVADDKP